MVKIRKSIVKVKKIIYCLVYFLLFLIGFYLLKFSHIFEIDKSASILESASKFIVMIITLIALTRWGMKLYKFFIE